VSTSDRYAWLLIVVRIRPFPFSPPDPQDLPNPWLKKTTEQDEERADRSIMVITINSDGTAEIAIPGDAIEPNDEVRFRAAASLLRPFAERVGLKSIRINFDDDDTK
jgi:hypothetical protein